MKNFKNYLLIAIFSLMSFVAGLTIHEAKASVNNFNEIQADRIDTQTIYVDGQRYVVFTSGRSSMFVIRK